MNEREFERELHSRTVAYQPAFRADDRPVVIEIPAAGQTPDGHLLASALVNQLARAHRRLVLVGELEQPLQCPCPFGHRRLVDATAELALAINPLIEIDVLEKAPDAEAIVRLGIGEAKHGISLGAEGWLATLGNNTGIGAGATWGAMLASCLGAWLAFARMLGRAPRPLAAYSLWDLAGGAQGPTLVGPLDLGRVLQVGAGGVGAALDLWLASFGVVGEWTIADGDLVEVSNLNRQILFTAADAGYPIGASANKAQTAARRLGALASPEWYGEVEAVVEADYDVVLALANERGAREALQDRRAELLLHATTSANHQAQAHRHLPGRDDCIRCRLPGQAPVTACSSARVGEGAGVDASLPYLSALAGLMLGAALAKASCGALRQEASNLVTFDLGGEEPLVQALRAQCRRGCPSRDFGVAKRAEPTTPPG